MAASVFCSMRPSTCTPNHQGIRLCKGDWILGHETAEHGRRLIYAMEVFVKLNFDVYYRDSRFQQKKPRFDQSWRWACEDNIYHRDRSGNWVQDTNLFHDPEDIVKDTKHPTVFVSRRFYYFGAEA